MRATIARGRWPDEGRRRTEGPTLLEVWARHWRDRPDLPVLVDGWHADRAVLGAELDRRTAQMATTLAHHGVRPGDRVVWHGRASLATVPALLGASARWRRRRPAQHRGDRRRGGARRARRGPGPGRHRRGARTALRGDRHRPADRRARGAGGEWPSQENFPSVARATTRSSSTPRARPARPRARSTPTGRSWPESRHYVPPGPGAQRTG